MFILEVLLTHYELGYTILCQNRSTCLNTYNELGYFELITGETCQHECEKLINCVKAINPFWHKPIYTKY